MAETIHILLPVHNRREITRRFIQCLKRQTYGNYHVVLIDDGSTDGTDGMVRGEINPATVIKGHGDWWWAGSLQQGYLWLKSHVVASDDLVLIINDDTEFEADFLERAVSILSGKRKTLLLAHCYSRDNERLIDAGIHIDWKRLTFEQAITPDQINCLSTRGLFLRVRDLFDVGGFYPKLLPHYASDYEFTIRAQRKGMKLMTDPSLRIRLDEETTGNHTLKQGDSFFDFVQMLFSKKTVLNPLVWIFFILLSCPWKWKIKHILWIIYHNIKQLKNRILLSRSPVQKIPHGRK
jgi:GT2 family glycosyltransferase